MAKKKRTITKKPKHYVVLEDNKPTNIVTAKVVVDAFKDEKYRATYAEQEDGSFTCTETNGLPITLRPHALFNTPRIYASQRNPDETRTVVGVYEGAVFIDKGGSMSFDPKWKEEKYHLLSLRNRTIPRLLMPLSAMLGKSGRHLYLPNSDAETVKYSVNDGQPLICYRKSKLKAGKWLRKVLPSYITDKQVQEMARLLDSKNPAVAREREVMEPEIHVGLAGGKKSKQSLGSCMYSPPYWGHLDKYLFLKKATLDDLRSPPAANAGVLTLLWTPSSREVHGGNEQLRTFVWPVTLGDGKRAWYVDRVYPSSNHSRKWVSEFCTNIGISLFNGDFHSGGGSGTYGDRAKAQPTMSVSLRHPLYPPSASSLPWLDTFIKLSADGHELLTMGSDKHMMSHLTIHTTGGGWGSPRNVFCSKCGGGIASASDVHTGTGMGAYCSAECKKEDGKAAKKHVLDSK